MILSSFSIFNYDTTTSIVVLLGLLMIPLILWSFYASFKVNSTYNKYNRVEATSGLSGYEAARKVLDAQGLQNVQIRECRGVLTDHYDPRSNIVFLSQGTINSRSVAAIGVACHEVGHAIQYARGYLPVKIRGAIVPVLNLTSKLITPLIIINIFVTAFIPFGTTSNVLLLVMIGLYAVNMLFSLVTLPCEFNASHRAKCILAEEGIITDTEMDMTRKVLSAAAMTYVASFVMSLVQLLRLVMIYASRNRND